MTKQNKMWDNSNLQEEIVWGNVQLPGLSDEELYKKNWNKARDQNKLRSSDVWIKNYQQGIQQRNKENIGKNNQLKYEDPEYLKQHRQRMLIRTQDPDWQQKVKNNGIKRRKAIKDPNNQIFDSKMATAEHWCKIWNIKYVSASSRLNRLLKDKNSGFIYVT